MKKIICALIIFILTIKISIAQWPTYTLTVKNGTLTSINAPNDAFEFDVYISNTNGGVTNFEFAGSQLFFSFNRAVLTGPFPPTVTDTSVVRYRIIGSDLPSAMQPRSPGIATATSPTADVLRLAINTFPGAGSGIDMTNNGFPGTKIVRLRLHNKTGSFAPQSLQLAWRNPPIVAFATKIFAYVGTTNTDITTPATHSIDPYIDPFPGSLYNIILFSPANNSIDNLSSINFIWKKRPSILKYIFKLSTDSLFSNFIHVDSSLTDTIKSISGLNYFTKYFWQVRSLDSFGIKDSSLIYNFKTLQFPPAIVLKLSVIPEGLYFPQFNLMARRDTVKVYLRNTSSPYNIVDTASNVIDSINFTNKFYFYNAAQGTYYVQINHRNSIETWSKIGGQFFTSGDTTVYNFTTSNTQAYGNNLKLKGSKYCIYSGDVNQDDWVDIKDFAMLDNDSYNLVTGNYIPSDLNGDNIVDGVDFLIGDNNWRYVRTISPLSSGDRPISP